MFARDPLVLAQTKGDEDQGQFSPDGHWVAYTSNETGLSEIYVIPFPPAANDGKWMVSKGGGIMPRWRRDGKALFYVSEDWKMTVFPDPRQIVLVCLAGRSTLGRFYIVEILSDCSVDCLALCRIRVRLWFDISSEDFHFDVPRVQRFARRGTNGLPF